MRLVLRTYITCITLLFNFNVRTHKLEIDAPVHVASEGTFQGTREEKVYNGIMDH